MPSGKEMDPAYLQVPDPTQGSRYIINTFLTRLIFRTVFALASTTRQWLTKPNF